MANITKIYQIQLTGEQELLTKMKLVNDSFKSTSSEFKKLKSTLSTGILNKTSLQQDKDALNQSTKALIQQRTEAKILKAEVIALQNAKQGLRLEEMKDQQAALQTYSAYQKLSRELVTMKQEAKGIGVTFGVNSAEFQKAAQSVGILDNKLKTIDSRLGDFRRVVGGYTSASSIGGSVSQGIYSSLDGVTSKIASVAAGYIGFMAVMQGTQAIIHQNYELSDSLADLQIRLKGNKADAESLFESLKKIDTRTSLGELVTTASLVAKKGVAKEEIEGITEALDQYFVVAGKEAGSREEGTSSIIKLISIFNNDHNVTKERVTEIATALTTLQNSGVATGAKMIDVAERIGAIRGITGVTLPGVLGFAAALEQLGQKSEVAGTAGMQILTKILSDVPKYAKLAGISVEDLRAKLANNPFDGVIAVAEGVKGNAKSFEQIAKDLEEVGVRGARVKGVLGDIAGNADFVKKRMMDAALGMKDPLYLTEAFAVKNDTFAASIDKVKKAFETAGATENFRKFLKSSAEALEIFIKVLTAIPFGVVVTGISVLTGLWAFYKTNLIANTIAQSYNNDATLIGTIRNRAAAIGIGTKIIATEASTIALGAETVATEGAVVATDALNLATKATPWGFIIGSLVALLPLIYSFVSSLKSSTAEVSKQNIALKTNKDFQNEIAASVVEQTTKVRNAIDLLIGIIKDENSSLSLRKKAYEQLIQIAPDFTGTLDNEFRATDRLNAVYDTYILQLQKVARAKAIQNTAQKYADKEAEAQSAEFSAKLKADKEKQNNDAIISRNKGRDAQALNAANTSGYAAAGYTSTAGYEKTNNTEKNIFLNTSKIARAAELDGKNFLKFMKSLSAEDQAAMIAGVGTPTGTTPPEDDPTKTKPYRGSRLNGYQKDYLKDLEATRNRALAILEKSYIDGNIQEEDYLKGSLLINQNYYNKKIAYLKGGTAEERKQEAQAQLDKAKAEKETNDKLYGIATKKAESELKLKDDVAKGKLNGVLKDPYSTEADKLSAQELFNQDSLNNQVLYTQKMLDINIEYSKVTIEETNKLQGELKNKQQETNQNSLEGQLKQTQESLNQVSRIKESIINRNEGNAALDKTIVLNDKKLDQDEKSIALETISAKLSLANINAELGAVDAEIVVLDAQKLKLDLTIDQQKTYNNLLTKRNQLITDKAVGENNVEKIGGSLGMPGNGIGGIAGSITDSFKNKKTGKISLGKDKNGGDIDGTELVGEVIAQSFNIAETSMNNYFDRERDRVEKSKKLAYERIDIESQQAKNKAQSSAEVASLDRQAAAKKQQEDKIAGEKLKKIKKEELAIALAVQLANIGVAAAGNPANAVTFGVAGTVMYSILAGLALAQYGLNSAAINSTTFGKGGRFGFGGMLDGPSHSENNGMPVINPNTGETQAYLEGGEGIINKRSMRSNSVVSVTGTPNQIASRINGFGGGVDWAGGGTLKSFANGGNYLGNNLQAPVFRSYFTSPNSTSNLNSDRMDRIENNIENLAQITRAEAMKKVVVSNSEIFGQRAEYIKQTSIATL